MKVVFSGPAKQELEDAVHYYDIEYPGLGRKFKEEVKGAAIRITEYPEAWSIERGEVRKCLLHKFPYKLLYSIEKDHLTGIPLGHILIIAVAHLHRQPNYWMDRWQQQ